MYRFKNVHNGIAELQRTWDLYTSFFVYGQNKLGKTTMINEHIGTLSDREFCVIRLIGHGDYQSPYSPFQLAYLGLNRDAYYEKQINKRLVSDVSSDLHLPFRSVINFVTSHNELHHNMSLLVLSDVERRLIAQMEAIAKKRTIVLFADNIQLWDSLSRNLFSFLMTEQARNQLSFLDGARYIVVSNSADVRINCDYEIELLPCISYAEFLSQICLMFHSSEDSIYELLFSVTGGNLGYAQELIELIEVSDIEFSVKTDKHTSILEKSLTRLLRDRVRKIDNENPAFLSTMEVASIIGSKFEPYLLKKFDIYDSGNVVKILSIASERKFIKQCYEYYDQYEFYNALIYAFFYGMPLEKKKDYHHKLSILYEKIRNFDYFKRYYHLYNSGAREKAFEMLSIHLMRLCQKGLPVATEHILNLQEHGGKYYESFCVVSEAMSSSSFDDMKNFLNTIDESFGILTVLERDYTYMHLVSTNSIYLEYEQVLKQLEDKFINLKDEYFEHWVRFGMFYIIFCANRMSSLDMGARVEKKLMYELSKRIGEDKYWEYLTHIINRNSAAIYSIEIALTKIQRSAVYFQSRIGEHPEEYLWAITNYSGALIMASQYEKAFKYASDGMFVLENDRIYLDRVEKLINNYVVSGYLSGKLSLNQSIEIIQKTLKKGCGVKFPLIENNLHVLFAFSGDIITALHFFERQHQEDIIRNHNDFYRYLFFINYVNLLIITSDFNKAIDVLADLNRLIPAIMEKEKIALNTRYAVLEEIAISCTVFCCVSEYIDYFGSLCSNESSYFKNPFLLTDQQFWSAV